MNSAQATHERVRRIVARDLRPVRPLLAPGVRLFLLVPIAAMVALLAAARYGPRADFDQLGDVLTWGLSGLQWIIGLLILGIALRRAIPGYGTSRIATWSACGLAVAAMFAITAITYSAHQTFVPPSRFWPISYLCFLGPLEYGAPLLIFATILAARAFPTRPGAVGGLCGLAAGVMTDAGWRLTCWITAPAHVLGTHLLAAAVLAGLGAAIGAEVDRRRSRTP